MSDQLLVVAAGGLAREVHQACVASGREVVGFLDDDGDLQGHRIADVEVLGPLEAVAAHPGTSLLLCAGSGRARESLLDRLRRLGVAEDRFATFVDRSVRVPPSCRVGRGSVLLAGTVLTADVTVGRHCVVMPNVTLTHDNVVGDFATICAGVTLGGHVGIGRGAYLGMNASVRQDLQVGDLAVLGMGAVLLSDLPAGQTWGGVPARELGGSAR